VIVNGTKLTTTIATAHNQRLVSAVAFIQIEAPDMAAMLSHWPGPIQGAIPGRLR
jgi:hypothetical protein